MRKLYLSIDTRRKIWRRPIFSNERRKVILRPFKHGCRQQRRLFFFKRHIFDIIDVIDDRINDIINIVNIVDIKSNHVMKYVHVAFGAIALLAMPKTALSSCECGFVDEANRVWMDALVLPMNQIGDLNSSPDLYLADYVHSSGPHGNYTFRIDPGNVAYDANGNMLLTVNPPVNGVIKSAEVATRRKDFKYGTFRSVIELPKQRGSCVGFFHYYNDTEEIDVEYIGQNSDMLYVSSKRTNPQDFSPDIDSKNLMYRGLPGNFVEYGFDWLPSTVEFFVNGKSIAVLQDAPSMPGRIYLDNWSSGNIDWSGTPTENVIATVRNLYAFFNSTSSYVVQRARDACDAVGNSATRYCTVSSVSLTNLYGYNANVLRASDPTQSFPTVSVVESSIPGPAARPSSSAGSRNAVDRDRVWVPLLAVVVVMLLA